MGGGSGYHKRRIGSPRSEAGAGAAEASSTRHRQDSPWRITSCTMSWGSPGMPQTLKSVKYVLDNPFERFILSVCVSRGCEGLRRLAEAFVCGAPPGSRDGMNLWSIAL